MITKQVKDLQDGDVFSIGGEGPWFTAAVVGFGTVSVYLDNTNRGDDAPTIRIEADPEDEVTVVSTPEA